MLYVRTKRALEASLAKARPVEKEPAKFETRISNIQSTARILRDDDTFDLTALILHLPGLSKFNKTKFPALSLHLKICNRETTCMVFRSGKMVLLRTTTIQQTLFVMHVYRLFVSRAAEKTVSKNIVFDNFRINNFVVTAALGYRVDLKALRDGEEKDIYYVPELFPGARFKIWLRPKSKCCCKIREDMVLCECSVKCTLFDTGTLNIVGAKSIADANRAKNYTINLTKPYKVMEDFLPKSERFEARRKRIFDASAEKTGIVRVDKKHKVKRQNLSCLLALLPSTRLEQRFEQIDNLFLRACCLENFEMALLLYQIDPKCLKHAMLWANSHQGQVREDVVKIIKNLSQ